MVFFVGFGGHYWRNEQPACLEDVKILVGALAYISLKCLYDALISAALASIRLQLRRKDLAQCLLTFPMMPHALKTVVYSASHAGPDGGSVAPRFGKQRPPADDSLNDANFLLYECDCGCRWGSEVAMTKLFQGSHVLSRPSAHLTPRSSEAYSLRVGRNSTCLTQNL
jgi:hypothetical protein